MSDWIKEAWEAWDVLNNERFFCQHKPPCHRCDTTGRVAATVPRLIRIADAAQKLVEALPRCVDCGAPATHFCGPGSETWHDCDEHRDRFCSELDYAEPLRALLAALSEK